MLKVFMSVDIEGIGGIVHPQQTSSDGKDYDWARGLMAGEANAAIAGAFDGGATEVLVNDSHGDMRNLKRDVIDARAVLLSGSTKPMSMMQGLDSGSGLVFLVGYHAMAGSASGVINHTHLGFSVVWGVRLNGEPVGESALTGAVAGALGVPVGLVAGDAAVAAEAKRFFPSVETAIVKEGIGRYSAKLISVEESRRLIREAATRAVQGAKQMRPFVPQKPARVEVDFGNSAQADRASLIPGVERVSDRTTAFTSDDCVQLYRVFQAMVLLGNTAG